MKDSGKWKEFDPDRHCAGSAIVWEVQDVRKVKRKAVSELGTEAAFATPLSPSKRRKKRHPDTWQKVSRKKSINTGKSFAFKNRADKVYKETKEKKLQPPCGDTCKKKCKEKITEEGRQMIFDDFWSMGDIDLQRSFLAQRVICQSKKRTRIRDAKNQGKKRRNRIATRIYTLIPPLEDDNLCILEPVNVCQKFFLNTLAIDETRVESALRKGTSTGAMEGDLRGHHNNHRTAKAREEFVIEHIGMFRVVESHYVRKNVKHQYLPQELTISHMHGMYVKWCGEKGYVVENYDFYSRVFRERFDLRFQKPKKDECDRCTDFNNTPVEARTEEMIDQQERHVTDKEMAREHKIQMKEQAQNHPNIIAAAFDLEKVLLCPYGQTSSFYYSKRLKVHNFTITDINSMETHCFLWHEGEAEKGSCEIGTSLQKYVKAKAERGCNIIHFFSDRCGGQNNNRMVIIAAAESFDDNDLDMLTLNYLASGHSQNENDNAHSVIETAVRKKKIYTLDQWETAIQMAFQKNSVEMIVLNHKDIIDFKNAKAFPEYANLLSDKISEGDRKLSKENKIYWSRIMQIKFMKEEPGKMFFKYNYNDPDFKFATIRQARQTRRKKNVSSINAFKYHCPVGISDEKKKDMLKLCDRNLIPAHHRRFYADLPVKSEKYE